MSALKFNTILTAALALALASFGCDGLPGQPTEADRYQRPTDILDFETLYGTNCSGCHGAEGHLGPVRPLNDPLFLAIAGAANLRKAATHGVAGTAMPAFGLEAGGVLTPPQINAIVSGMFERWGDPSLDPSTCAEEKRPHFRTLPHQFVRECQRRVEVAPGTASGEDNDRTLMHGPSFPREGASGSPGRCS